MSSSSEGSSVNAQIGVIFNLFAKTIPPNSLEGMGVQELTNFLLALDAGASETDVGVNSAPAELSALMAATLIGRYDSRNIGSLNKADFHLLLSSEGLAGIAGAPASTSEAAAAELARIFAKNDLDGDGLLDRHDVRRMVETDGSRVTDREVDEILEQAGDDIGETHMTLEGFMELSKTQGW